MGRPGIGATLLVLIGIGGAFAHAEGDARVDAFGDPLPDGCVARLGTVRLRHAGRGWPLGFSPDDRTLCTAWTDDTVRWWEVPSGRLVRELKLGEKEFPHSLSADGGILVLYAFEDPACFRLRQADSGKELLAIPMGTCGGNEPALSRDGKRVYACSRDRLLRVWDASDGKVLQEVECVPCAPRVAFSPDGSLLATYGPSVGTRIWSAGDLKVTTNVSDRVKDTASLAFSPDARRFAVGDSSGAVSLWDVDSASEVFRLQVDERTRQVSELATAVAFSPDGKLLAAAGRDSKVLLVDMATRKVARTIPVPQSLCERSLVFSHDGKWIAASTGGPAVGLWEVATGQPAFPNGAVAGAVEVLAFSPDGKVLMSASSDGFLMRWDTSSQKACGCVADCRGDVRLHGAHASFSPDGTMFAAPLISGECGVFSTKDGSEVAHVQKGKVPATAVAFLPDGRRLAVQLQSGAVDLWDVADRTCLYRGEGENWATSVLCVSPEGRWILTNWPSVINDGRTSFIAFDGVRVLDARSGTQIMVLGGYKNAVKAMAVSPDGGLLALAPENSPLVLLDMETGASAVAVPAFPMAPAEVARLAFSPDGRWVARNFIGGEVRVWDTFDGHEVKRLHVHHAAPPPFAFSADGGQMAVALEDSTIELYGLPKAAQDKAEAAGAKEDLWKALASRGAQEAHRALAQLVRLGDDGTGILERTVQAVEDEDKRITKWIEDLDDDDPSVREAATQALTSLGPEAHARLEAAEQANPSAEKKARLKEVLQAPSSSLVSDPEMARTLRAIRALAAIGTPRAREVLARVAKGSPLAPETQAAVRALERLGR